MSGHQPLVSVCVPTYNRATYLKKAISSVLEQTFKNYELIIVDNASTDETRDVVASFNDARISYYRNTENIGMVRNWNRCIELSCGEYINIFHDDDVMLRENIESKVRMLQANPGIAYVHSAFFVIDEVDQIISKETWMPATLRSTGAKKGDDLFAHMVNHSNCIIASSVLIRKKTLETRGFFDASLVFCSDMELWMRLAVGYDVGYFEESFIQVRRHSISGTQEYYSKGTVNDEGLFEMFNARATALLGCARQKLLRSRLRVLAGSFLRSNITPAFLKICFAKNNKKKSSLKYFPDLFLSFPITVLFFSKSSLRLFHQKLIIFMGKIK